MISYKVMALVAAAAVILFNIWLYRRIMSKSSTALPTKVGRETAAQYVARKENDQRFGK